MIKFVIITKKPRWQFCVLITILFLCNLSHHAQASMTSSLFSLSEFSVQPNNLLPIKDILKLAQDQHGFIRLGTRTGTYHFDDYLNNKLVVSSLEQKIEPIKAAIVMIKPKFYQTLWFKVLLVLCAVVLLFLLFRWLLHITKRKQYQKFEYAQVIARAEMMSEMMTQKNQLLAEVTHDLRTSISMIKVQLEAMQDGVLAPDEQAYERIQKRIASLNQLVGDVYQISLNESRGLTLNKTLLSISELLEDTLAAYRPLLALRHLSATFVQIQSSKEHDDMKVNVDESRMVQVFGNLLKNSCRYTDTGGNIKVSVEGQRDHISIIIEDSAPAVDESELTLLFDRQYRAPSTKGNSQSGSGLGLWISKSIVQAHNGEITAKLSPLGGLSIIIELPRTAC